MEKDQQFHSKPSTIHDPHHYHPKALEVLGRDLTEEKIVSTLGITEEELQKSHTEKIIREEEKERKKRMNIDKVELSRKKNSKALETLGHDPSLQKIIERLGISEKEVEEARRFHQERTEELIKRMRDRSSFANKKYIQKALEILGHDPSKEKLRKILGILEVEIDQEAQKMTRDVAILIQSYPHSHLHAIEEVDQEEN